MEEEWKTYYEEGVAYSKAVVGAKAKKKNLGNAVLYNLIGLSLESLLTALIVKDGDLPDHSSVGSMFRMLRDKYEVPESFREESRFYNKFMNFCALDITPQIDPADDEIDRMTKFMTAVQDWVALKLPISSLVKNE